MRTLAVLSRKGGTGKTTVALHMAVAAHKARLKTLLSDMDPQRSALDWSRERGASGPQVIETKPGALFTAHQAAQRSGIDLMVLDTRPSSDIGTADAVRYADLCLVVVRPCFFDLKAIERTVELISSMGRKGLFLLNQAPHRRQGEEPRIIQQTAIELEAMGLPVAKVGLRYRAAYQAAARLGCVAQESHPDSHAAFEVNMLWREVRQQLWPVVRQTASAPKSERPLPFAVPAGIPMASAGLVRPAD